MSWTDFFRSRYVRQLEKELAEVRSYYKNEIEQIKKNHADELERVITEANRGWAEADRLRIYLVPGLPATTRNETPDTTPHKVEEIEQGQTPFQRYAAREYKRQEEEAKAAAAAKKVAEAGKTQPPAQPV